MNLSLSSPDIGDRELELVREVLTGPALSLGPMLPRFERELAEALGSRYAVALNSGTSALHLCVRAAGIGEDDEVITTPFSFVASANCVLFERAKPVFVDIDPLTYNIDPARIGAAVTPRTRAVLPVHVFGRPCDMEQITATAERHDLKVIEDSCEAIGATIDGKAVGTFGTSGTFAFYPNKQITTGEGGAVVTDDETTAKLCRSWRNQGRGESGAWLQHERLGYNYRLSDINCALGIAQVERLHEILRKRANVARMYSELLAGSEEVFMPTPAPPNVEVSWFVYVVRLANEFTRENRDAILDALRKQGIGCNNYFSPIHLQPYFREQYGYAPGDFPITEHVSERTIALPFHNHLTSEEITYVVRTLNAAVAAQRPLTLAVA